MSQTDFCPHKDLRPWVKSARKAGFTFQFNGDGHLRVTAPDGEWFAIPATMGSQQRVKRAINQFRRSGRRMGLDW